MAEVVKIFADQGMTILDITDAVQLVTEFVWLDGKAIIALFVSIFCSLAVLESLIIHVCVYYYFTQAESYLASHAPEARTADFSRLLPPPSSILFFQSFSSFSLFLTLSLDLHGFSMLKRTQLLFFLLLLQPLLMI